MGRLIALRVAAVALYAAYWALWSFAYIDPARGDMPRVVFAALTVALPAFLVGAALDSWWAPAVGLIFVAFAVLPDHCVVSRDGGALLRMCSAADEGVPLLIAVTTPCVLAGVAAVKLGRRLVVA